MRLTWSLPADLVPHAVVQAGAEGVAVDDLVERWRVAGGSIDVDASGTSGRAADTLERLAGEILDEIDARTPALTAPAVPDVLPSGSGATQDRLAGAWWGRAIGCTLGKPVEKIPREGIREIARATGNWPVHTWFTARGLPDDVARRWPWNRKSAPTSLAETISGIPEDDDLNFALLGLEILEQHGTAVTTDDVATAWLNDLPAGRVFTAERAAYRNLLAGVPPERAALVRNPFRDWIGALIRADVYGWAHPGDPAAAARHVDADALLSHRGDGLEGARFAAALAAEAVVADDMSTVLERAMTVLDPSARIHAAVRFGIGLAAAEPDDDRAMDALHAEYGHLHWVHVLNNTALIAYALAAGRGDLGRSISLAVTAGWDTDSAGATVGAVCGAMLGAAALPPQWTDPLGTRFATSLPGMDGIDVAELARRTGDLTDRRPADVRRGVALDL